MIVKIMARQPDPGNLIRYLANTQPQDRNRHQNQHTNPTVVGGNLGYTGPMSDQMIAAAMGDLRAPTAMFPTSKPKDGNPIWHVALSLKPGEAPVSAEKWAQISKDFLEEMGVLQSDKAPARWVAVNHGLNNGGADHVHLAVNLIRLDGTKVNTWQDMPRAQKAAAKLEAAHGLHIIESRHQDTSSQPFSKDDSGISKRLEKEPRLVELERLVRAAAAAANSEHEFVAGLTKQGVEFRPFRQDGKVKGYSVSLPEAVSEKGNKYWWAGGKLARDLSLPRLRQSWEAADPKPVTQITAQTELTNLQHQIPQADPEKLAEISHRVAGALAAAAVATEQVPGPLSKASRQCGTYAQTKKYQWRKRPPALGAGMLMLQAVSLDSPVAQAVLIKQLMATWSALNDAHRAAGVAARAGRKPSMAGQVTAEEELMETGVTIAATVGARMIENHARSVEAKRQQRAVIKDDIAKHGDRSQYWDQASARMRRELGYSPNDEGKWVKTGPAKNPVAGQSAADPQTPQQVQGTRTDGEFPDPTRWKDGAEPASSKQLYTVGTKLPGTDLSGLTKAEASMIISGKAATRDDAREQLKAALVLTAPEGGAVEQRTNTKLAEVPPVVKTAAEQAKASAAKNTGRKR